MTVFLIDKKRKIELTLREFPHGVVNWNLPMNTNDFRVFKDVQNTIEFVVRNTDRKPVNMMGRSAKINIYDHRTNKLMWTKDLKIVNEAKGICKLNIEPDIMADWLLQTYSYSVTVTNTDGSTHMLYVDANECQRGFLELLQGPVFDPRPSQTVLYEDLHTFAEEEDGGETSFRFSSALPGSMQTGNTAGLHTVVLHNDNFTGKLTVQGSVEPGTPGLWDWFDIETHEFDHNTGIHAYSIEANLMWVRFWVYNAYEQLEDDELVLPADQGKITRITFRS
jgi:hypothetical protein